MKTSKIMIGTVKKLSTKAQLMPTLDKLKVQIEVRINESKNIREIRALRSIDFTINDLIKQVHRYDKM
jgi:hypothetical protein